MCYILKVLIFKVQVLVVGVLKSGLFCHWYSKFCCSDHKFSWIQFFNDQGTSVYNRKHSEQHSDLQNPRQTGIKCNVFQTMMLTARLKISSRLWADRWKSMVGIDYCRTSWIPIFFNFCPPKTNQTDLKHAIAVAPSINTITFQQTQFTWYSFKKKLSLVVKYEAYENSTSMVF